MYSIIFKHCGEYTTNIKYINCINTSGDSSMQNRKDVKKRNVALKIETYERLEKYKIKLMSEKEDSRLTFDDVINALLDKLGELP